VQIAILSQEITLLIDHLKDHKKDFSSRRGLIKKVNERRKLLNYMRQTEYDNYVDLCKKLKLKYSAPKVVEAARPEEVEV
jgi:small subunit ribosomal protein S15